LVGDVPTITYTAQKRQEKIKKSLTAGPGLQDDFTWKLLWRRDEGNLTAAKDASRPAEREGIDRARAPSVKP
jgi:hypothetical protein